MKILIVGAGASGIVAAINYKRNHPSDEVFVIEHLSEPLKKLLATGNGRCNLANTNIDISRFSHPEFVKNILKEYNYKELCDSISLKTRVIDGLVYPYSESAVSVRNAFLKEAEKQKINIKVDEKLIDYNVEKQIEVITNKKKYQADRLYLATSLLSGNGLGSDGSILKIIEKHNYKIKRPLPGLCPIVAKEDTKILDGMRIKCEAKLYENNKLIHTEKGEVLFKKNGLSGIVIFNISSLVARGGKNNVKVCLDLLPDISLESLKNDCKTRTSDELLNSYFSPKIAKYLSSRFADKNALIEAIKNLEFTFEDFYDFIYSQVSVGGVDLSMVNDHLESKHEKGVYLLGELLDVDGPCGGYNLTWAFASAIHATKN